MLALKEELVCFSERERACVCERVMIVFLRAYMRVCVSGWLRTPFKALLLSSASSSLMRSNSFSRKWWNIFRQRTKVMFLCCVSYNFCAVRWTCVEYSWINHRLPIARDFFVVYIASQLPLSVWHCGFSCKQIHTMPCYQHLWLSLSFGSGGLVS